MTHGATGTATSELVDLVERLRRLVPQFTEALAAAQREREELLGELAKRAPKLRAAHPGPFTHVGQIVRWLREEADLTRPQFKAQTGLSTSTIRNIEKARHQLTATTRRKLLAHPAMATLPARAQEAGLSLGLRGPGGQRERTAAAEPTREELGALAESLDRPCNQARRRVMKSRRPVRE